MGPTSFEPAFSYSECLGRLKDYVCTHLSEQLTAAKAAEVAGLERCYWTVSSSLCCAPVGLDPTRGEIGVDVVDDHFAQQVVRPDTKQIIRKVCA